MQYNFIKKSTFLLKNKDTHIMNIRLISTLVALFLLSGCETNMPYSERYNNTPLISECNLTSAYSIAELTRIISDEGYSLFKEIDSDAIVFKASGRVITLYRMSDGDIVLIFGIRNTQATIESMNAWNKNHRLSRAYIDEDGDPIIESDLMANGGVNKKRVSDFIQIFVNETIPMFINQVSLAKR